MTDLSEIPNIIAFIRNAWPVSDSTLRRLAELIVRKDFPRRGIIVRANTQCGRAYFIEDGMTRSYWLVDGEEFTTSFSTEGSIVFSMDEVYYGLPSEEYVEAVDPVKAYSIDIPRLMEMIGTDLGLCNWWRKIHQDEYRRIHRSHKERLTLPARERYIEFSKQFPEVCRRARLGDIASYLGITQATLSRIRAQR